MKPIISKNIRIRHPESFRVGNYSIVDDFCYFSTQVLIGNHCHVAANSTIGGGGNRKFELGDFGALSSGVRIWCTSDGFTHDLTTLLPPSLEGLKTHSISGDVILGKYTGVGANSILMPNNIIPEGTVIGALSMVPPNFKFLPWCVYWGNPIRLVGKRDQHSVMKQAEAILSHLDQKQAEVSV